MKFALPETLADAIALLAQADARCLAGGQSLVAMMNARLVSPSTIVSLRAIPGLDRIEIRADGGLLIGAMARHTDVARIAPASPAAALLSQAASVIAHPAIRNQGTIGGAIAHADPSADYPPAIVCAAAIVHIAGPTGKRTVPATEFIRGYYETALVPGEIVTDVEVPSGPAGAVAHYEKYSLVDGDFAVISAAVILAVEKGRCTALQLAIGGGAPTPIRLPSAEAALIGTPLDPSDVAAAGRMLAAAADPIDDFRGSADYRRKLIPRIAARAIASAQLKLRHGHARSA